MSEIQNATASTSPNLAKIAHYWTMSVDRLKKWCFCPAKVTGGQLSVFVSHALWTTVGQLQYHNGDGSGAEIKRVLTSVDRTLDRGPVRRCNDSTPRTIAGRGAAKQLTMWSICVSWLRKLAIALCDVNFDIFIVKRLKMAGKRK